MPSPAPSRWTKRHEHRLNLLVTLTLLEMIVALGLGVTLGELAGAARDWEAPAAERNLLRSANDLYPPEQAARRYADDQAVMHSGRALIDCSRDWPGKAADHVISNPCESGSQRTSRAPVRLHQLSW